MSESSCNTALKAAQKYLSDGFSIIPLIGGSDSDSGKRPPIRWQPYQQHPPTLNDLDEWCSKRAFSAYGIVCGCVSHLAVLDLDDAQTALDFALRFPQLMQTLVVRSGLRGTPHIYWHVDFHVKTQPVRGGDLKGEGSYVVGAGSCIAGGTWTIINDAPVRPISPDELAQVLNYLQIAEVGARYIVPSSSDHTPLRHTSDFAALYHRLAHSSGRNNALFAAACAMRDEGYTSAMTVDTLAHLHTRQFSIQQVKENQPRRHAEALRTITSAYSRPPRPRPAPQTDETASSRLPNHLRELLLRRPDGTALLRFIEGMFVRGALPGASFTEPQARQRLSGLVGRHSILRALQAVTGANQRIFSALPLPFANPTPANADLELVDTTTKNAFCQVDSAEQKSKPASRPPRYYRLPTAADLCALFGVTGRGSDPIKGDDLASPTRYRQGLHREFIKRRPGQYSGRLLGARIGVSSRTIRRYNREIPINVQPCYLETRLYWHNLDQQIFEAEARRYGVDLGGRCLRDGYGKRYPARRSIAEQLLAWGQEVVYQVRTLNYYWYGESRPPASFGDTWRQDSPPSGKPRFDEEWRAVWQQQQSASFSKIIGVSAQPQLPALVVMTPSRPAHKASASAPKATFPRETPHARSSRFYRRPLEDNAMEAAAQSAYAAASELSLANARRLVMTFGARAVNIALRRLEWLADKGKISNAAGFMRIAVPACWREHNPDVKRPRFVPQPKRSGRVDQQRFPAEKPVPAMQAAAADYSAWFSAEPTDKRDLSSWLEWADN